MIPTKLAAMCYITRGPLILGVLNPKYGAWSFPGGKVEDNEGPADGALRELREETSLEGIGPRFLYEGPGTADPSWNVVVYSLQGYSGEPRTVETGNVVAWITRHHLTSSKAFGAYYERFFEFLDHTPI